MAVLNARRTSGGHVFLNAGCGDVYSPEWNNLDIRERPGVDRHDIRVPLPYSNGVFDAVYSAHVVEHLNPEDGLRFLREMLRVLKPGGICRTVVPDYERACREYLRCLEQAIGEPDRTAMRRYRWSVIELVDQFVREQSGGRMLEALRSGDFDEEYVRARNGEEFAAFYGKRAGSGESAGDVPGKKERGAIRSAVRRARRKMKSLLGRAPTGPRETGELHRWAYDRLSLRCLMEEAGFLQVVVREHDRSLIPDWDRYRLDSGRDGLAPRKPDSLYMEGEKPGETV